jgi:hypothetical protein
MYEGKHFETKCTPAGILFSYLDIKYLKFKFKLNLDIISLTLLFWKYSMSLTPKKY